jgi:hypothetical protein
MTVEEIREKLLGAWSLVSWQSFAAQSKLTKQSAAMSE